MQVPFNPSIGKLVLLTIVTCGIYYLYWNFKFNSALNSLDTENPPISSGMVLLSIFCFPVGIYLFYKWGKKMQVIVLSGNPKFMPEDNSTLLAVFGFLFPLISACIIQDQLNTYYISNND